MKIKKLSAGNRSASLTQSEIRHMSIVCAEKGGINMAQGICDLPLASPVKEGAADAITEGHNCYTRYDGIPILRKAISEKARAFNKIKCDPEKNIIVSAGATGVFYSACMALLDPGDEVIVFEPYYGYHINTIAAVGAKPVYVRTNPPDWKFRTDDITKAITPKCKAILINTPANPSGKVFTRGEIEDIAEISIRHSLFIITDEIYEYFVYDDAEHISPASIPEIADRTITISGYSKTFSITGWRVGYCICHEKWAEPIGHLNDLIYVCAPAPLQHGVAKGINELDSEYYLEIKNDFQKIRDKICSSLLHAGLKPFIPRGAYYILADVSSIKGKNSREKALALLDETGIATVPGKAFYHDAAGENLVRFCFAKDEATIEKACSSLEGLFRK
ncbi:MAG: aminotransferase [Lentisphaerae bacterium GWF2_44_16]|nr:MAG: aminotransferase [Lentisphaerae bacterium GWF2_44_16]